MNYFYVWKKMCSLSFSSFVFIQEELQANLDLIQTYRLHIAQDINQDNLQLFLTSYNRYSIFICLLDSELFLYPSCSVDLLQYVLFYWIFFCGKLCPKCSPSAVIWSRAQSCTWMILSDLFGSSLKAYSKFATDAIFWPWPLGLKLMAWHREWFSVAGCWRQHTWLLFECPDCKPLLMWCVVLLCLPVAETWKLRDQWLVSMKIQQKHSSKLLLISLVSYHVVPSTEKVLLSLSKSPSSPSAGKTVISFGAVLSDRETERCLEAPSVRTGWDSPECGVRGVTYPPSGHCICWTINLIILNEKSGRFSFAAAAAACLPLPLLCPEKLPAQFL